MSPSSSRRQGLGVFNLSFTTSWETVSTSSHSSSYLLSLSPSSSTASESTSSGYSDGNGELEQQSMINDDTTQSSSSPNLHTLIDGYKFIDNGKICLRCRMPLMIQSSDNSDNNHTGVCVACEEDFERKLVDFAAIHAKKTSDEEEYEDDDESNENKSYDEFIDDDDDEDASSSCSSYGKFVKLTTQSVTFGNFPRRREDDVKVLIMDDSNVLSYQVNNGASMDIEVTLAPIIDKTSVSPTLDLSVLVKEEIIPSCSRQEEEELQQSMTEKTEKFGREDNTSSRNLKQSNNDVGLQKLEAIREKSDDGSYLIPPPLLKKTMAALHAAKEAVVLSKAAAWPKVCLENSPKHHEEKVRTPQTSNKTVLVAETYCVDALSASVDVEDQVVNEYEEENAIYIKPQSIHSEHKWKTNVVLQSKSINEERNPINVRDDESQQGSRSIQSVLVDCKRDEVDDSDELDSCEAVEDGRDSLAMRTLDELCMSKLELISGYPLENAAENFSSLIRHSSNIKANLPPSVARSVIVKSLITKFWKENSEVNHNQQSSFHKEYIGESNNIDEQKSQMDPTTQDISKDEVNGNDSLSVLADDKHQMDDTTSSNKAILQQLDPLAETSTHSSGKDPPYEMLPKYCLALSVTDPPDETSSLPIIDPPDLTGTTDLSFLSSDRDPPEESEPIITLAASISERYCKPAEESFYSEDSFYSKWRKIRYDAMSTVELHAMQESMLPNVNDADIRSQLAQLELKFSQNVMSSVIPIVLSNGICDKPMDPPSSVSESMSNKIFARALDKMNTLDDYLRLIDVPHNRQQHLPLSPTAAARRRHYKEKLIEERLTRLNTVVIQ